MRLIPFDMGRREGGGGCENDWETTVKEKLEGVGEGRDRDREEICNRVDRRSKKWRGELHRNMAEERGAAEWKEEIMACEASSPPYSSQAIAGLLQRLE